MEMSSSFEGFTLRPRAKRDARYYEDAPSPQVSPTTRVNVTMAPSTKPTSLIRLAAISCAAITLCGLWLWWFMTGGGHIRLVPIVENQGISVTIPQGTYIGVDARSDYRQTLEQFLGIPYAQSTGGERRFMPPVAIGASKKTFQATEYGNRCPAGAPNGVPQTEDCLNLNIYRPKEHTRRKLLPVLIHIHGGSFNFGFGHNRAIDNMVGWSSEPFIGVSFNYRLGAFGFLPSNLTAGEGLLNVGLKDQALLFEWVQHNIAAFGGNPNDVTIMGSSAGAHSVSH
jgi:acetylcholinesterase